MTTSRSQGALTLHLTALLVTLPLLAACAGSPPATPPADSTPAASASPQVTSPADPTPTGTTVPGAGGAHPDGRIVFGRITRMDELAGQVLALYAIDPDGENLVQLTEGESAFPEISPDGTRIAYTLGQPDGSWQIATMAADGSDVRVLTNGPGIHSGPTWSADGSWIAYEYSPTLPDDATLKDFQLVIYRMNADGSGQELLGEPDTFDIEPRISPDGSSILFQRLNEDHTESILVVRDLSTGDERTIDAAGTAVSHPTWSPDGVWIIYNVGSSGYEHVQRIRADGSGEPVVVTDSTITRAAFKPWYSPDGSRIVMGCIAPNRQSDGICLIDADGSNFQILVDEPGVSENHPTWGVSAAPPTAAPLPSCPNPHGGVCLGPLEGGTYTTLWFKMPLTYTVPDGWANYEDLPGNFLLVPPSGSLDGVDAGTSDYIGVYHGVAPLSSDCEERPQAGVALTPDAMAAWYASHPGLEVVGPEPVTIGGLNGVVLDLLMAEGETGVCRFPDFDGRVVPVLIGAGPAELAHALIEGLVMRLYLLSAPTGEVIAIEIDDLPGGDTMESMAQVVEGFEFGADAP